jgi:two-component system, NarL family, response regulator LiaR
LRRLTIPYVGHFAFNPLNAPLYRPLRAVAPTQLTSSPRGAIILHMGPANGPSTSAPGLASVRVALVDDHELFRRGLHELLTEQGLEVVGEASDGEEAVRMAREEVPDVILMDVSMPGIGGVEATRRIRTETPHTRVVMLTVSADQRDVEEAILAGASGYLDKDAPIGAIVSSVAAAARGEALLSPAIAANLLARVGARDRAAVYSGEAHLRLTDRERDVLELMAAGRDNPQIAEELFISVQTVKNHVSNILAKLEVENRIQAAVYAVRRGLV